VHALKVVHIGLGKTATSSLQAHVFPRLAEMGMVRRYNPPPVMQALDGVVNGWLSEAQAAADFADIDDVLISNETLVEWDPAYWEEGSDRLLRLFGPDATIILTLREPDSYLRSLYQQMLHSGKIRTPQDAFLPANAYQAVRRFIRPGELEAINIDAFDLSQLINLYATRFRSVLLLPVETLGGMGFLGALWPVSEADRAALARAFAAAPRVNISYSRLAVRLTLGRERLLAGLGLRSLSASDAQLQRALFHSRGKTPVPKRSVVPSWNRLMRILTWYGPKTPFALPPELYLGQHQARNRAVYATLRAAAEGYVHLRDGRSVAFDPIAVPDPGITKEKCV